MTTATKEQTHELEARYRARLEQETARVREDARKAVEEFKRGFPPPNDAQIEKLLYPELSEFAVELGGQRFTLRELPALAEKKFLRLVEKKLPTLVAEVLSLEERLGENAEQSFSRLLGRAGSALDLVTESCALVLDPSGEHGLTSEFIQQHASTARQVRILQAQLSLNGARDFLSRLFPALGESPAIEGPVHPLLTTPTSRPQSAGSNSCDSPPEKSQDSSPWDNFL